MTRMSGCASTRKWKRSRTGSSERRGNSSAGKSPGTPSDRCFRGTALLTHSFGEFQRRGKLSAELGVDAESMTGAVGLYERAGMRVLWQWGIWERDR